MPTMGPMSAQHHLTFADVGAIPSAAHTEPRSRRGSIRHPLEFAQHMLARMAASRAERRRARQAAHLLNPPGVYHGEGNRWRNSWDASYRSF